MNYNSKMHKVQVKTLFFTQGTKGQQAFFNSRLYIQIHFLTQNFKIQIWNTPPNFWNPSGTLGFYFSLASLPMFLSRVSPWDHYIDLLIWRSKLVFSFCFFIIYYFAFSATSSRMQYRDDDLDLTEYSQ